MNKILVCLSAIVAAAMISTPSFGQIQQAENPFAGLWKSQNGSVIRISGSRGVLIDSPSAFWEKFVNTVTIKDIRRQENRWTAKEWLITDEESLWVEAVWELSEDKIKRFVPFKKNVIETYFVKIDENLEKISQADVNASETKTPDLTQPAASSETAAPQKKVHAEFGISLGYRVDDLDWNIAGDITGNNPNILSELTWSDLEIVQIKLSNRTILRDLFYFRGSLGYGMIFKGSNQDSDYAGDNRTLEFSRSNNNASDGSVVDATLGAGLRFSFGLDWFGIAPLVGYSYHQQNLTMTDGYQTSDPYGVIGFTGPFAGLNSKYNAEWKGPWVGLDVNFDIKKKHNLFVNFEYHWADYYAEADWNLRTDFAHPKSFEHDADGSGMVISAGVNFYKNYPVSFLLNVEYQDWNTDPGIDRTFFSNGTISVTRLNEVNWKSYAVMIGMVYGF
ncbi:MAG: hypothetical protein AB1427_06755 [Thermodesulfobacteriota bacterium]